MAHSFKGVIPILATPFNDDESLDLASWQKMIAFMVDSKVDGITILGVLGESNRLSDHERETLIKSAVATVGKKIPVIVGTSHTGSAAAAYLSTMAENLGADAVMVTPAKEPVPNDERIVEYYRRISEKTSLPIVLQDHPASTEVHMSAPLILRIVKEVASVACIKAEAVPTPPKIRALRAGLSRPVSILSGLGALYAPFDLEAGSDGFNTGFAFPEVLRALVDAANAKDFDRVHALYARFAALIVFEQQPGLAIRKEILKQRGLIASNRVRHPGATITAPVAAEVAALISRTLPGIDVTRAFVP
ncbi:MAG: dihydrodipicolinate synthase family protein [Betaproteobacteria bacterium]|nr:dihydrodipicolinate synthase family protein [Betaproteobacteria bacterium]